MSARESIRIVPAGKKRCVWMEANVVSYKLCDNNYDCSTCSYDHAMQDRIARYKSAVTVHPAEVPPEKFTETWVDKMMKMPASQRKCRYMISGEVDRKLCPNAYECGTCAFDQMMQDRLQSEFLPAHARTEVGGFQVAEDFYYHEGHTWARPEHGGRIRVGLDDFAQKLLGRISELDLPAVGQTVSQGQGGVRVRKNGKSAEFLSPVDGIVTRINYDLAAHPEAVNESPYEKGWLMIIEPTRMRQNLKSLHYGEAAREYVQTEREKLFALANEDMRIAADGGASVEDVFEELENVEWSKIVRTFFRTKA